MRPALLKTACCLAVGLMAVLSARPDDAGVRVRLRLRDAGGQPRAGIVRVFRQGSNQPLALSGLFDRLRGLERSAAVAGWYVVPAGGADAVLPRTGLRFEALAGLETALSRYECDLSKDPAKEITVALTSVLDPDRLGFAAGNTHLHLRNLSAAECDEYLRQIPAADGLRVLFISYLERHKDDVHYVTNRYPVGELRRLSTTGVLLANGEEHRHNFDAYGEGYGHVMFLGLKKLVRPVSLGPGITGGGDDDRPLRPGLDAARKQGATVIWCHNTLGFEDVPSALAGRLDALNVFDGSRTGTFADNYYRYLNIGLRVPISTGTDWFVYDFARVYARVGGKLTIQSWLEAVKAGRTVATNGPLLTLRVDGRDVGETFDLEQPRAVRVEAAGVGRHDFGRLQLVHNGKVVAEQPAGKGGVAYEARLQRAVRVDAPGWLAVRIEADARNELGQRLFAHSSPVYLDVADRRAFDLEAAEALLRQVEEGRAAIRSKGRFTSREAEANVLALYDEAVRDLKQRMERRGQ